MAKLVRGPIPLRKPRVVMNAVEGWGKTSLGAFTPDPAIIMAGDETGYETLLGSGLVPDVDRVKVTEWKELLALVDEIAADDVHKTIVIDALGGFEAICHDMVKERDYAGKQGKKTFEQFAEGARVATDDWKSLLSKLDAANENGKSIIILSHSAAKGHRNPMGSDFDRYTADVSKPTWAVTGRWADAVFFGQFITIVDKSDNPKAKKGKGIGGTDRILYTEQRDAFDAKNRYGLPAEIDMPDKPSEMWRTIWSHLPKKEQS